ncbi:MAG: YcxB family protein [Bacteroidales bacterium]|jgi:hypothetical protein|nr:YcxB family protein [Bacteroidales bacterium]
MKIEYTVREKDLLEMQWLVASRSKNLRKQQWTGALSITVFLPVLCLHSDIHMQSFTLFKTVWAIAIGIFAGGLFFFLVPRIYWRHCKKQVKTSFTGMIGNTVELQITNDFMETRDKTGETKVKLTAIKKVCETENLFVIQSDSGSFLTIPKPEIDFTGFRNCLCSNGLNPEMVAKTRKK